MKFDDMAGGGTESKPLAVRAEKESVSPERAFNLLVQNRYEGQRDLRKLHVTKLAQAMAAGQFGLSVIRIGKVGGSEYLIDGQHRMNAVVEAGVDVDFLVSTEEYASTTALDTAYAMIDGGLLRSKADIQRSLAVHDQLGVPANVATAATTAVMFIETDFNSASAGTSQLLRFGREYGIVTRQQLAEVPLLMREQVYAYWRAIQGAPPQYRRKLLRAGVFAVALVTLRFSPECAVKFWYDLASADGLRRGEPLYAAKEYLTLTGDGKSHELTARAVAACWNAMMEGREMGERLHPKAVHCVRLAGTPWAQGAFRSERQSAEILAIYKGKPNA